MSGLTQPRPLMPGKPQVGGAGGWSQERGADAAPLRGAPSYLRGSKAIAASGTAASTSHGTAAGRPVSRRVPMAELPRRTMRPETEDNAPV
ncbi:hypothetical protein SAMN04487981_104437 [Streptomyces sp. cf386]|nr:hypothetical protein SAMN04487981_104437 [Streptomyces sp. cf386]